MQLKKIQNKDNSEFTENSIKKISSFLIYKKILLFSIIIFFIGISLISIFFLIKVIKELPIKSSDRSQQKNNLLFKMAEEYYKNGFLENSAIYYQNYLKKNPSNKEKIISYKRLFEIKVLTNEILEALYYLDKWEEIDKEDPVICINRIKILLREDKLIEAKRIIDKNYSRFKKSVEFKELIGIYFIKQNRYENALNELLKIPIDKREVPYHNKIINCYLKLNQISNALAYINRIELKLRKLENKDYIMEIAFLKAVVFILKGEIDSAIIELKAVIFSKKYRKIALKFYIYCNILNDTLKEVENTLLEENSEFNDDPKFLNILGDYFYYKNKYDKAIEIFEKIDEIASLDNYQALTLADIYFKAGKYTETIKIIERVYNENNFDSPNIYKNLSVCYNRLNDSTNEFFYLSEGSNKYKDDIDFYVRIAKYYFDRKEYSSVIQYVDKNINLSNIYDKRLENLKILSLYLMRDNLTEKEMLIIREKEKETPEYYFKLIEFYLKNKKYIDAKREIETINNLSLSNEQKNILNIYKLILSSQMNNEEEYNKYKNIFLNSEQDDIITKLNKALIFIKENEHSKANQILDSLDFSNINKEYQQKVYFLKAIIFYYEKNFSMAYKFLEKALDIDPYNKKSLFLKRFITNIKEF